MVLRDDEIDRTARALQEESKKPLSQGVSTTCTDLREIAVEVPRLLKSYQIAGFRT